MPRQWILCGPRIGNYETVAFVCVVQTVPRHNAPPPHYWVTLREEFRKGLHPQFRRGRATCNNTRSILNHNQPGLVK